MTDSGARKAQVSVIIPNFNRETLIGETLRNLLEQTVPPHEIIVVDDGSTDKSVEVVRSFGSQVKLLCQANQGPGVARNTGLRAATGEFIQFQDSDDLFARNKLAVQTALLERTGADIAFSPWVKVRIKGKSVTLEDQVLQQAMPPEGVGLACWWLRGWSTVFQSLLFRRTFLDRVGFYRTDMLTHEDAELFFRALTSSPKVAFSAETLTIYRLHEHHKLTQDEGTSRQRRVMERALFLRLLVARSEECGLKPDGITRLLFLASIRKEIGYLKTLPEPSVELVGELSRAAASMPGGLLDFVLLGTRLAECMRLRVRGSRWMKAYQAGPLTSSQRGLLHELGFDAG